MLTVSAAHQFAVNRWNPAYTGPTAARPAAAAGTPAGSGSQGGSSEGSMPAGQPSMTTPGQGIQTRVVILFSIKKKSRVEYSIYAHRFPDRI